MECAQLDAGEDHKGLPGVCVCVCEFHDLNIHNCNQLYLTQFLYREYMFMCSKYFLMSFVSKKNEIYTLP